MKFAPLVENEILKLLKRRRFRVALLILVALNGLIVFAQTQAKDRRPGRDWRIEAQERVARMQNWERSGRLPKTQLRWVRFEIARVQYHLDRNVNPDSVSGPLFARAFASASSYLLLPLLAILFAADIVSSEFAQGTIKLLLTRPVGRARVLSSKLAALVVAITLTVALGGLVAYLFGGLAFGYRGWGAPVLTGFRLSGETFDPAGVRSLPLWEDALIAFGRVPDVGRAALDRRRDGDDGRRPDRGNDPAPRRAVLGGATLSLRDEPAPSRLLLRVAGSDHRNDPAVLGRRSHHLGGRCGGRGVRRISAEGRARLTTAKTSPRERPAGNSEAPGREAPR